MSDFFEDQQPEDAKAEQGKGSRAVKWLLIAVMLACFGSCVLLAAIRSRGLTKVTVTALDAEAEPKDFSIPIIKEKEALPDYELALIMTDGRKLRLGARPDESAVNGITWYLSEPVCVQEIASVRLDEKDKVLADSVAEVQLQNGSSVTENGYRFDFTVERSLAVGLASFWSSPLGKAISMAFTIALVVLFTRLFGVW